MLERQVLERHMSERHMLRRQALKPWWLAYGIALASALLALVAVAGTAIASGAELTTSLSSSTPSSAPLRVAVASNFRPLLEQLIPQFSQRTGIDVEVMSASSGTHYSQILNNAPMDMFLSADQLRPELLESQGLTVPGSRHTYALGQLALWQRDGTDVNEHTLRLWPGKLAIANPAVAPYGAAARQVLEYLHLWHAYSPHRLVQGNNVAQATQFVASGNVGLGLVALSDLRLIGKASGVWIVPQKLHSPIVQQLVILRRSPRVANAELLSAFLLSTAVQQQIAAAGYISILPVGSSR